MTSLLVEDANKAEGILHVHLLEEILRAVEPGAMLVPPWLMQNVIAFDQGIGRSPFAIHDYQIHVISRARLLKIAEDQGLGLAGQLPPVDTLILLARPHTDWLAERTKGEALRHFWRLLFHCRIAAETRAKLGAPPSLCGAVETRIERIGRSAFNEAKFVLQRERCLTPHADDTEVYAEFAAVYLELDHFRPDLLAVYFPSISDKAAVLAILTADVNAGQLIRQTRLEGALDPQRLAPRSPQLPVVRRADGAAGRPDDAVTELAQADRAALVGNTVRAAILRQRCSPCAPDETLAAPAQKELNTLVNRLSAALGLSEETAGEWRSSLCGVLGLAVDQWWNQEARLLYDLQKACVDHEREIYSVGVVAWLLEFGRRPLRRPQPNQRIVLICKALRSAIRRVPHIRVDAAQREHLTHLLHDALHHTELRLREALRPAIAESLKAGGLIPHNAAERVAENKLVEELLDGITHRRFLTLSSVRDAISNNQIKFKDIPGPRSFISGDPLFRIDRRLSDSIDGVYHRGEIYLRLFQRVSSVLFATLIGRFITRTVLMPLAGSYIIIAGLDHTLFALTRLLTGWEWLKLEPLAHAGEHHNKIITPGEVLIGNVAFASLAVFLLGVLNWPAFRHSVWRGTKALFRGLRFVLYTAPKWVLDRPAIQALRGSRAFGMVVRYVVKPLPSTFVVWLCVRHLTPQMRWTIVGGAFVVVDFLLNNPAGRAVEQAVLHWLRALGARVTSDILGNLFSGILHFFRRRLEEFDRMLYAVDEWLRFRAGQPRSSLYFKAALGIFWFYVAYVSRFAANLLVEPQVNPIKHFPVVTVSHKIILPQAKLVAGLLPDRIKGLAVPILFAIPGIFGFLAWELRSNWQLYRSNRARFLKPVMVGSHGESMARLLRPGFHSGTVPKIFARLREAHREADEAGVEAADLKHHEAVEHVGEAVSHFIERELLALLNEHPAWSRTPVVLNGVTLATTRITIELACPALNPVPMRICFEQRGGWIMAGTEQCGFSSQLSPTQAQFLGAALLGLYKIAGVDVVKEQVESVFSPQSIVFDLSHEELTVWPDAQFDHPLIFKLHDETAPQPGQIDVKRLLFHPVVITWDQWVAIWEPSANGAAPLASALPLHCVFSREIAQRAVV